MARWAHGAPPRALPRPAPPILVALYTLFITAVVVTAEVTPTDPCTITLTASPSTPTLACAALTLTAAVARSKSTLADGVITFYANGRAVTPSVALVDGSATAVVTSLTPEAYTLTAAYTPSSSAAGCSAGVSAALAHGVRKAVPALSVTPVPAVLTPPADCDITRAQFWVAARPPPGCPPATGGLVAYLVPGVIRDPAVWRPLAPPGAADAARMAAAAVRGGQAAASTAFSGVSGLLGGAVGGAQPVAAQPVAAAASTPTTTQPSPSLLPALEPARLPAIVRAVQAGYAVGRQAGAGAVVSAVQVAPQAAAVEALPQPSAPPVNTTPHTTTSPSPSLTLSLLTHRPDARIDAAAASRAAHAGALTPPRTLGDRRRLRQATASIINATTLANAGAGSPLGHLVLGAAPLLPSSIIPGASSRGGITPATGVAPPGDYTVVVQYSGDPNYEAGAVGGAFVVDRGCVVA